MYNLLTDYSNSEYVPYQVKHYLIVDEHQSVVFRTESALTAKSALRKLNNTSRPFEYLNHLHAKSQLRDAG
jgi:hypothetical protein